MINLKLRVTNLIRNRSNDTCLCQPESIITYQVNEFFIGVKF